MSGEKRTPIQILQDEMRDHRKQLYNIQSQRDQLQQELKKVRQENTSQVTVLQQQLEEQDQKQTQVLSSLKSDMRQAAEQHNRQLLEQRRLVLQEMQELESRSDQKVDNLRSWAKERLDEQRNEYNRIAQQQQGQINKLKQDIDQINQREEKRTKRASDYLSDLEILIQSTDKNFPHDRFKPGGLDKIRRQLLAARQQLNEDAPAATIATVQAAHFDLMDLESEVRDREAEFEITYRTVADAVGGLFASVRQNRHIQLEKDATLQEVNYWTQGRYQLLEDEVRDLKNHIDLHKDDLTTEALNAYLEDLETLTNKQEELVEEAVERIISSQLRAEMSDVVIAKLEQQGYQVKNDERGYEENDQRSAYMVKLHNLAGIEVVTVISPDKQTYQNVLSVNTYNEDRFDDAAKRRRNEDILAALGDGGLTLGTTVCNDQSIAAYYDVDNLIKQKEPKISKQVLQQASSLSSSGSQSSTPSN